MSTIIAGSGNWNWLILAACSAVLELLAPGAFMLWLGLSAIAGRHHLRSHGRLVWQYQLVAFAVFALASIPLWRRFASGSRRAERPAVPQPPRRRLRRPRVHAGEADRRRQRHGEDRRHDLAAARPGLPGGSRVKVVRADAATLVVAPV